MKTPEGKLFHGNGGKGGDGGDGGNGGNGNDGGSSGKGSDIILETKDSKLFMLFECDSSSGKPGVGGKGGKGGLNGVGGLGGLNGPNKRFQDNFIHQGRSKQGNNGNIGLNGKDGKSGNENQSNGIINYILIDENEKIIEQSNEKYNLKMINFDIIGLTDNDIYEPGESISFQNIKIKNTGGLTLPEGSILTFESSILLFDSNNEFLLPSLKPNEEIFIKEISSIFCKIIDKKDLEKPKQFEIKSSIKLLNRSFKDSILIKNIKVEYPIIISELNSPKEIGKGEKGLISIKFSNISSISYGNENNSDLKFKIILDEGIISEEDDQDLNNPQIFEQNLNLSKNENFKKEIEFKLDESLEFFEIVQW